MQPHEKAPAPGRGTDADTREGAPDSGPAIVHRQTPEGEPLEFRLDPARAERMRREADAYAATMGWTFGPATLSPRARRLRLERIDGLAGELDPWKGPGYVTRSEATEIVDRVLANLRGEDPERALTLARFLKLARLEPLPAEIEAIAAHRERAESRPGRGDPRVLRIIELIDRGSRLAAEGGGGQ